MSPPWPAVPGVDSSAPGAPGHRVLVSRRSGFGQASRIFGLECSPSADRGGSGCAGKGPHIPVSACCPVTGQAPILSRTVGGVNNSSWVTPRPGCGLGPPAETATTRSQLFKAHFCCSLGHTAHPDLGPGTVVKVARRPGWAVGKVEGSKVGQRGALSATSGAALSHIQSSTTNKKGTWRQRTLHFM